MKSVINITRKKVENLMDNIKNKNDKSAKSIVLVECDKNSDDSVIEEVSPFTRNHQ